MIQQTNTEARTPPAVSSSTVMFKLSPQLSCNGQYRKNYYFVYNLLSINPFQPILVTQMLDGVSTTTAYGYDQDNHHLAPTSIRMTNSDDKKYITENRYVFDMEAAVYDSMANRNQINQPVEVLQKVVTGTDTVLVSGTARRCDFFDFAGLPQGDGDDPIYPYLYEQYEMTWDENGQPQITGSNNGWDTLGYISAYNTAVGKPANLTLKGWKTEYYFWNAVNKQIAIRQYEDFEWRYNYYDDTRLLREIVDIDGQDTDFTYDLLMRPLMSNARDGHVLTHYTYHYANGSAGDHNYIQTRTDFTPVVGSNFHHPSVHP